MRPTNQPVRSAPRAGTAKTQHVQTHSEWWIVVYQGQPATVSSSDQYHDQVRYARNGWHNESMARTQAAKYNGYFDCADFDVRKVI